MQLKNAEYSEVLGQLGLAFASETPPNLVCWCLTCNEIRHKVVKWIEGLGYVGHRRDHHILEVIPESEFPAVYAPGWAGRVARATYAYVRYKLKPEDLVLEIGRFNGVLDESKPKRVPKCGACAYFHTPACSSPSFNQVWHSGDACDLFYAFSVAVKEHPSQARVRQLLERIP
jgi:hypothetical protein